MVLPYLLLGRNVPDEDGDIKTTLIDAGIDIRYQPQPNITGLLTINPDFSQVEEAVTDISFSYNEKYRVDNRTFFQEGSAYFGATEYFYSNRIPDFYAERSCLAGGQRCNTVSSPLARRMNAPTP
jgi:hypothetical protein